MTPVLTLNQAKKTGCCRICGHEMNVNPTSTQWQSSARFLHNGVDVTLNFGKEFAHTKCVNKQAEDGNQQVPEEKLVHATPNKKGVHRDSPKRSDTDQTGPPVKGKED